MPDHSMDDYNVMTDVVHGSSKLVDKNQGEHNTETEEEAGVDDGDIQMDDDKQE